VYLFVETQQHMTALGAMRQTVAGLAAEIGWPEKRFRKAIAELAAARWLRLDERARLIFAPRFLEDNRPESPNVVKAWASSLELLPNCALKHDVLRHAGAFTKGLGEGFQKAFAEAFVEAMPNQETGAVDRSSKQEQEQGNATSPEPRSGDLAVPAKSTAPRSSPRSATKSPKALPAATDAHLSAFVRAEREKNPDVSAEVLITRAAKIFTFTELEMLKAIDCDAYVDPWAGPAVVEPLPRTARRSSPPSAVNPFDEVFEMDPADAAVIDEERRRDAEMLAAVDNERRGVA
jgi:hypothetical protein